MGFGSDGMNKESTDSMQVGAAPAAKPMEGPPMPNPADKQYKMGIGGRILGMANNFLQGLAHRGPVVYTGRGALNGRYYRDLGEWQSRQASQGGGPGMKPPQTTGPSMPVATTAGGAAALGAAMKPMQAAARAPAADENPWGRVPPPFSSDIEGTPRGPW